MAEYVFVNYSTDRGVWADDVILSVLEIGGSVGVEQVNNSIPENIQLYQNFPNPFNPITNIHYSISESGNVKIVIYDLLGQEIRTIVNEKMNAGNYIVNFDGSDLSSGIYYYSLESNGKKLTREMLLMK